MVLASDRDCTRPAQPCDTTLDFGRTPSAARRRQHLRALDLSLPLWRQRGRRVTPGGSTGRIDDLLKPIMIARRLRGRVGQVRSALCLGDTEAEIGHGPRDGLSFWTQLGPIRAEELRSPAQEERNDVDAHFVDQAPSDPFPAIHSVDVRRRPPSVLLHACSGQPRIRPATSTRPAGPSTSLTSSASPQCMSPDLT
jgi:hypothetical protein